MRKIVITAAAVALTGLGGLAFVQDQDAAPDPAETTAESSTTSTGSVQPIQFPHDVHAGTYQMDCLYCHFSAERSVSAGIPPVESCMGCHRLIAGATEAQQAEIAKLREYYNAGEPIPWTRIYKISDHARFPHMRHVNAGLECQECHGEVQNMGVIEERDPAWGGDNMGWCITCHVERDVSRDCTVCHY